MAQVEKQWKKATLLFDDIREDTQNIQISSTDKFKTSNPSTSTSTMPRLVNVAPYKIGDSILFAKRRGFDLSLTAAAGNITEFYFWENGQTYSYWNATGSFVTTNLPTWASSASDPAAFYAKQPSESVFGTTPFITWMSFSNDDTDSFPSTTVYSTAGWYQMAGMTTGSVSATFTSGSAVLTGISSTAAMYPGQIIGSTAFPTNNYVYILTIDSGTQITVSENSNATGAGTFTAYGQARILSANFPANTVGKAITGSFVHKDGYAFIMTTSGQIYNSDINTIATWQATSNLSVQEWPDRGITCAKYKNYVVGFGTNSIEFFRHVENATGSPLQRVEELALRIGIISPAHVITLNDDLFFISNSKEASSVIYKLDNFIPKRISTPALELALNSDSTTVLGKDLYTMSAFNYFGQPVVMVHVNNATIATADTRGYTCFVYFIEEDRWVEWRGGNSMTYNPWYRTYALSGFYDWIVPTTISPYIYAASRNGKITYCKPSAPVYKDHNGTTAYTFDMLIQTPEIDLGTENRKFLHKLRLLGNLGTTISPSAGVTLYWSDDFGQTWKSRTGVSTQRDFTNLGSFRKRIFRIVDSNDAYAAWKGIELIYKEGSK